MPHGHRKVLELKLFQVLIIKKHCSQNLAVSANVCSLIPVSM